MPDPSPPDPEIPGSEIIDAELVPPAVPAPDYDEHGNPSFDYVRDRIEGRIGTAAGMQELQPGTGDVDEQLADREKKAAAKLAELRRSLGEG